MEKKLPESQATPSSRNELVKQNSSQDSDDGSFDSISESVVSDRLIRNLKSLEVQGQSNSFGLGKSLQASPVDKYTFRRARTPS